MFPESIVGIPEPLFKKWCAEAGLTVRSPLHFGSWCGRKDGLSYQDILILAPSS
jgi:hypothetical protein